VHFATKEVDFEARAVVRSRPVPGQAHWPTRRLFAAAAFVFAVLAIPALGVADSGRSIPSLQGQAAALAAKTRSATLGLYALDHQLATAEARLQSLRDEAVALRARRGSLARRLTIARRSATIAQQRLGIHVRALYERGDVSTLEVVFGARTLDDALSSIDDLHRMARQDADVLGEVQATRAQLTRAAARLGEQAAALAAATHDAAATAASLTRSRADRNSYIASLTRQRKLTLIQIAAVVARAQAAEARGAALMRAAQVKAAARSAARAAIAADPTTGGGQQLPPPTPPVVVTPGERLLTVTATGYAIHGRTATGIATGWGVAAVDPSMIPLGTHMTVPGYGDAVAADIGSGIVGASIDLWFPSVAQANAWGRRTVTIVLH
jgi:3D (Asp-Asp-Asp) domain-containing protein/peptidoglycan hydrolase CwlO-like protein